ncbi:MAG: hypothetical protein K5839_03215 [Treponemataceae bacterium]|nr:hypothetical protein [Treponemataceae bacterium]
MENLIYTQNRTVSSAYIDSTVKLGISHAVNLVQDNMTECFGMLKCDGVTYVDLGVFWAFTKIKVKFEKRPAWREKILAKTFPASLSGFRTNVNSIFTDMEGNTLYTANQEMCVLDFQNHRPVKLSSLPYPQDNFPPAVFTEAFEKFNVEYGEGDYAYEQPVRALMIDMSHHMTNNEYIKVALNCFTDEFFNKNEVKALEGHYTGECKEGMLLKVYKHDAGNGVYYIKIMESQRNVFEMKIEF